jgi:hypothetical protein
MIHDNMTRRRRAMTRMMMARRGRAMVYMMSRGRAVVSAAVLGQGGGTGKYADGKQGHQGGS